MELCKLTWVHRKRKLPLHRGTEAVGAVSFPRPGLCPWAHADHSSEPWTPLQQRWRHRSALGFAEHT